jgi:hypothetical protein
MGVGMDGRMSGRRRAVAKIPEPGSHRDGVGGDLMKIDGQRIGRLLKRKCCMAWGLGIQGKGRCHGQ